jgi:hypothetical protein
MADAMQHTAELWSMSHAMRCTWSSSWSAPQQHLVAPSPAAWQKWLCLCMCGRRTLWHPPPPPQQMYTPLASEPAADEAPTVQTFLMPQQTYNPEPPTLQPHPWSQPPHLACRPALLLCLRPPAPAWRLHHPACRQQPGQPYQAQQDPGHYHPAAAAAAAATQAQHLVSVQTRV